MTMTCLWIRLAPRPINVRSEMTLRRAGTTPQSHRATERTVARVRPLTRVILLCWLECRIGALTGREGGIGNKGPWDALRLRILA